MTKKRRNEAVLFGLACIIGVMLGLVSEAKPLYQMFCGATGLNGTTQNAKSGPATKSGRTVTVSFDGNVAPGLAWEFGPDQKSVNVQLGQVVTIFYHAKNTGAHTSVGTAVHNVQPDKAGIYFDKIQCFCFTDKTLKAGESVSLPVEFFVDPALVRDKNEDDVSNIILSYTFYAAKEAKGAKLEPGDGDQPSLTSSEK